MEYITNQFNWKFARGQEKEKILKFEELNLSQELLQAIEDMGFEEASPIQAQSIKPLIEGKDVIGQAQTGTGKTAAFGIPLLEIIEDSKSIQGLVLCPTRELCIQISKELTSLAKYKKWVSIVPVYGGTNIERQMRNIRRKPQIVVATPGRIMDLLRRKALKLDSLKLVILDEADEMFAMGFRDDMKIILDQTNQDRQTCFYSATMGSHIMDFSKSYQTDPVLIKVKHKEVTVEKISQYYLEMANNMKNEILSRLLDIYSTELSIVFCNTKKKVDELVDELNKRGYSADGLHGDLKQSQRDAVMKKFRDSKIDILVATDVAARGIDIGNIEVVFNYDLPQDEEYYVHRIGRTARAGRTGTAFTFVVGRDIYKLEEIIKYTKADIKFMDLPTINDMKDTKKAKLISDIIEQINKNEDLTNEKTAIDKLLQLGYGPMEIATNLMKMALSNNSIKEHEKLNQVDFGQKFSISRKQSSKLKNGRLVRKKSPRLFINKGKRDGLSPAMILAALNEEARIKKDVVGDIIIKPNFSFVEIPEEMIDKAITKLHGKKINKKKIEVEKSNIK